MHEQKIGQPSQVVHLTHSNRKRRGGETALKSIFAAVASSLAAASCFAQALGPDFGARGDDNKGSIELIDPKVLRVCADPNNLPFSNQAGEGFENKIAELIAKKLGKELAYTYYPGATGFVRNTLNAHLCDVILGIPQGNDLVQPTNPYYRTSYAAVIRAGSNLEGLKTLADPRLKEKKHRIGLVANTPPGNILAMNGLLGSLKSYPLMVDTRFDSSSAAMIKDLQNKNIDIALLWGPIAGYYAKKSSERLTVTPLADESGARMNFRIALGVRHSDQNWKRELNQLISQNKGEIEKILIDAGVPLLDDEGQLMTGAR
jgi:quinoprotein dehydrogenase-associated probable ABC transporter substrate-binding protein